MKTDIDKRDLKILGDLYHMCHDVVPVKTARMAAAVAIRGEVLSWGTNEARTHPFQAAWRRREDAIYWHAETKAIHNFIRRHDPDLLQRATVYVHRVKRPHPKSKTFLFGTARPCSGCFGCIRDFGIPRVIYSTNDGYACEIGEPDTIRHKYIKRNC